MPIKKVDILNNIKEKIKNRLDKTNLTIIEPFDYHNIESVIQIKCPTHNIIFNIKARNLLKRNTPYCICPLCKKDGLYKKSKYTKEICHKIALKYNTKKDFIKNEPKIYDASKRNNWIDYVCSHMQPVGNNLPRYVYSYEFIINDKKHVYVGVTEDIHKRDIQHNYERSSVRKFCDKFSINKPNIILLEKYIDKKDASIGEGEYLKKYISKGWIPINKNQTGALGKVFKKTYSFQNCIDISYKYDTLKEWESNDFSSFNYAKKNGFLKLIDKNKIRKTKYTIDYCKNIISKYKDLKTFRIKEINLYSIILQKKWNYLLNDLERKRKMNYPIIQYSRDKKIIKKWSSVKEACCSLNIDYSLIYKNLKGKTRICQSFIFKYDEDEYIKTKKK